MLKILTKRKFIWGIVVLVLFGLLFYLTVNNYKYNRYISEDMEQSIDRLNKYFYSSRKEINNILSNDQEIKADYNEINNLITLHRVIDRELFNLTQKCRIIEGKLDEEFKEIFCDFTYSKVMIFYNNLNERLEGKSYIILEDDDLNELKSILSFYNNTRSELNEIRY